MRTRENYIDENWVVWIKCNECWEFKTINDFNKSRRWFLWLKSNCRECQHKKNREHYENNKQTYINNSKSRRLKNPDRRRQIERNRRHKFPQAIKKAMENRKEKKTQQYWFNPTVLHWRANHYIKKYSLRPKLCPICNTEGKIEFHHTDVSKEDYRHIWVFCCKHCHEKIHTGEIQCPQSLSLLDFIS